MISVEESGSGSLVIETSSTVVSASNIFSVVTIFSNSGSIDSSVSSTVFASVVIKMVSSTFFVVDSFVGLFGTSVTIKVLVSVAVNVTGVNKTMGAVVVKLSDSVLSTISSSVNRLGSIVASVSTSASIMVLASVSGMVASVIEIGVVSIKLAVEVVISPLLAVTAWVISDFMIKVKSV